MIRERPAYQATGFFELGRIAAEGRGKMCSFFLKEVFKMKPLTFKDAPMAGIMGHTRIARVVLPVFVAVCLAFNFGVATATSLTVGKMYVISFGADTVVQANLDGTGGVSLGNLNGTLNSPTGIALQLPPIPAAVPTLAEWGIGMMSIFLGVTAIYMIGKKRMV